MRRQNAVRVSQDRAGADPGELSPILDRDAGEMAADVDQDSVSLALPVQRGAPRAKRDPDAASPPVVERRRDVIGVAGHHHDLGKEAIGARVRGVADQVERAGEDPTSPEKSLEVAAKWLGGACGDPVGGAVGTRAGALGGGHASSHPGRIAQNRAMPGATPISTSSGTSEAIAVDSSAWSSSSPPTVRDFNP